MFVLLGFFSFLLWWPVFLSAFYLSIHLLSEQRILNQGLSQCALGERWRNSLDRLPDSTVHGLGLWEETLASG